MMENQESAQQKASTRLPQPKTTGKPLYPAHQRNWINAEPQTREEMDQWIADEKQLIMTYLKYYKPLSQDETARDRIAEAQAKLNKAWKIRGSEADVENDQETDRTVLQNRIDAHEEAKLEWERAVRKHVDGLTQRQIHKRYSRAQGLWDDLHFFQNPWNRRWPDQVYLNAREEQPLTAHQVEEEEVEKYELTEEEKKEELDRIRNEKIMQKWRKNLFRLYDKWGVGERSNFPGPVGPDQLHIYPDNIRHTSKHPLRFKTLKERFPASDIRLDQEAIAQRHAEVERERKDKQKAEEHIVDKEKYAVKEMLPKDHQLYLSATEHSRPWHYNKRRVRTSWETDQWGPAVTSEYRVAGEVVDAQERAKNEERVPYELLPKKEKGRYTLVDAYAKNPTNTARQEKYATTSLPRDADDGDLDELSEVGDKNDYIDDDLGNPGSPDDGNQGSSKPSDEEEDELDELDDLGDLFRMSYLGLIQDSDSELSDPPGDDSDDEKDNTSRKPGAPGNKHSKPAPRDGSAKDAGRTKIVETFETDEDEPTKFRWVVANHQDPAGQMCRQRDRIPTPDHNADEEEGEVGLQVYPKDAVIPVPRKERYKGKAWILGADGIYRKDDLEWRPVFVLRKIDRSTGQYRGSSDLRRQFDEVIQSNFSGDSIMSFNKKVRQFCSRNDNEVQDKTPRHPPWTQAELAEAVRYLNDVVQARGVIYVAENWKTVRDNALMTSNDFGVLPMNISRQGDSVRTKLARANGAHAKLASVKQRKSQISHHELYQKDFFTIEDLMSEGQLLKSKDQPKRKRDATASGNKDEDGDEIMNDSEPKNDRPSKRSRK